MDRGWMSDDDEVLGPDDRAEMVQATRDMETVYDRREGPDDNNTHRNDWYKSTMWEYWIPGCLTECSMWFHKYFRISRERFDMIYEATEHPSVTPYWSTTPETVSKTQIISMKTQDLSLPCFLNLAGYYHCT